jgi:hypothetical protein
MISTLYQTVLSATAVSETESPDIVFAFASINLPPNANFSAQICLCQDDSIPFPQHTSEAWATPYILRYITLVDGEFKVTVLGLGFSTVNNIQNGNQITFGLRVLAVNGVAFATAVGTIFIQS